LTNFEQALGLRTQPYEACFFYAITRRMKEEAYTHASLCNYLRTNYPDVVFTSDLSGVRLPIGLARAVKPLKSSRGIPDLIIFRAAGAYHGLLIEIKALGVKLYTKNGELYADDHLAEQADTIRNLRAAGYAAFFVCGMAAGRKLIDEFVRLQPNCAILNMGDASAPLTYE
jgi:hypothetical protein